MLHPFGEPAIRFDVIFTSRCRQLIMTLPDNCFDPRGAPSTRADLRGRGPAAQTESFSDVGRHIHDPDVAVVLAPREIEGTTVGGKIVTNVASPTLELRESRDLAVA